MNWISEASKCPVLSGVDAEVLESLLKRVNYQIKNYDKDDVLAVQGDVVNRLMILLKGSVRGEMTDLTGKVIKIEDIKAPRPLAGAFLFGDKNQYPVDVIANELTRVLVIYREEFLKLLSLNQNIQMNYLSLVSSKAQFLTGKLKILSFKNLKGKMAHFLLNLPVEPSGEIVIPSKQQDIADLFGVARPSVARTLAEMEKEGTITVKNRKVRITNQTKLHNYLNQD